jgi:PleD family two-component response regulator
MFYIAGATVDTVTMSWRRFSDEAQEQARVRSGRSGQASPVQADEAQRVATWENEGGQSALPRAHARILIVDDDIDSSSSLERMLRASGHSEIRVACSGHAALAIAADFQPSMVMLEVGLLDMSGYEVARTLRERAQSHDLRLIALTSSREHAGRVLARVAGFERYLLKPSLPPISRDSSQLEGGRDECSSTLLRHPMKVSRRRACNQRLRHH